MLHCKNTFQGRLNAFLKLLVRLTILLWRGFPTGMITSWTSLLLDGERSHSLSFASTSSHAPCSTSLSSSSMKDMLGRLIGSFSSPFIVQHLSAIRQVVFAACVMSGDGSGRSPRLTIR